MAWLMLAGAVAAEVAATTTLRYTNGLGNLRLVFGVVVPLYIMSFLCLAGALQLHLQVSIAYAVWSGTGTAAIAVLGAILFRESLGWIKVLAIGLIVLAVVLLNLAPATSSRASHGLRGRPRPVSTYLSPYPAPRQAHPRPAVSTVRYVGLHRRDDRRYSD
jgi:small multidrug resistance pump